MKKTIIVAFIFLIVLAIVGLLFFARKEKNQPNKVENPSAVQTTVPPSVTENPPEIIFPIAQFEKGITKKPFGIYITPKNSPVQPERFSGYHTGVDVENEDAKVDVPVYAICDGKIVVKRWISGYGGTIVLKCNIGNEEIYVLYGHLNPDSFIKNSSAKKREEIAILGQGYSQQTDFERKHLHFAIRKNNLDFRGYVQTKTELKEWYNPVSFLESKIL